MVNRNHINLVELDLSKASEHEHPDLDTKHWYLCEIDGQYFAGRFDRQWYGWNFGPWLNSVGIQFDAPGSNGSGWQAVWRIAKPSPRKHKP